MALKKSQFDWLNEKPGWEVKQRMREGAFVRFSGLYFIIAVSISKFTCDGREIMGISTLAPIFKAFEGARAGEIVEGNGRKFVIEDDA